MSYSFCKIRYIREKHLYCSRPINFAERRRILSANKAACLKDLESYFAWVIDMLFLGRDLISRSTVVSLRQNDIVTLETIYSSDLTYIQRLSFKGFMYAPSHQLPVAWSFHATKSTGTETWNSNISDDNQIMSNITFNEILVNVGDVWSSTTNGAIIPVGGLYYVTFVLLYAKCHLEASLLVNDLATTSIVKTICANKGYLMTRERSVLLSLTKKDTVTVKIINGTVATCRRSLVTSFAGILVYPL